jgi:type II secretory pathway pseudopilin PulG
MLGRKVVRGRALGEGGFSLAESMVAMVVIGVVAFGMVKILTGTTQQIARTETASRFDSLNNSALGLARDAIISVGSDRSLGICRVIKTEMKTGGIGYIKAVLPPASSNVFAPDVERAFQSSSWTKVSSCPAAGGGYRMCFTPTAANSALPSGGLARKPVVNIGFVPVTLRPEGGSGKLTPIALSGNPKEENARDLAFLVTSEVSYEDDTASPPVRKSALVHSMVWAGEFTCHQEVSAGDTTRVISLSPSGIGSGADDHTLFSSQKPLGEDMMSVFFSTVSYTEGFVNNRSRAETHMGPEYTFTSACIEQQFRCSNSFNSRAWAPTVQIQALAQYNQNNPIIQDSSILANVGVRFEDRNGGKSVGASSTITGPVQQPAGSGRFLFTTSRTPLSIQVRNAADVCPQVCTGSNTYNTGAFEDNRFRTKLSFRLAANGRSYTVSDTKPTGCICCYGKQCGGIGTKIAGVCHKQPQEPVDARIPECAASSTANVETKKPYDGQVTATEAETCVAASVSGGKVVFSNENCSQNLPYLCFSQGDFRLARQGLTNQLAQGGYSGARKACYDMGMVRINAAEVRQRLNRQQNLANVTLPPETGGNFEYLDSALAGVFLAPQASSEILRAKEALEKHQGKVWIGLRNGKRFTYSEPPLVDFSSSRNISFFDRSGFLQFDADPDLGYQTGDRSAAMLINGRRHYGLFRVDSKQSRDLPALCFNAKRGGYFLSSGRSKEFEDGTGLCRSDGGHFLPPQNPLHWAAAMMMVQPLDAFFPWPTGGGSTSAEPRAAWVALANFSGGVWGAPAIGISQTQITALWQGVSDADKVTHSVCRSGNGNPEIVSGKNCSSFFSPEAMSPMQRLDFVRQIEEKKLWDKVFKIQAG